MRNMLGLAVVGFVAPFLVAGCGSGGGLPSVSSPPYQSIPGVPAAVNNLGYMIGQEQRSAVTPGGNQWDPGFSADDQTRFDNSNRLQQVVTAVTTSSAFAAGVASLKTLPTSVQEQVLASFATPLYPTWATNGSIDSNGTTDAGFAVEGEIATALSNAVKAAL